MKSIPPYNNPSRSEIIPLVEGVVEDRGRFCAETPSQQRSQLSSNPIPKYRTLYNAYLKPPARDLRKRMTKAEACLWKYVLRAGQMNGYVFNRQRPVLRYIADFMCKPLNLIIEVDGLIHGVPYIHKHDLFRQSELEQCGFTIVRFTNNNILHSLDSVRISIRLKIEELEAQQKTSPNPPWPKYFP